MKFSEKIIYSVLAFLGGILASEFLSDMILRDGVFLGKRVWIWSMACAVAGGLILKACRKVEGASYVSKRVCFGVAMILFFFAGVFYFHGSVLPAEDPGGIKYYVGREVEWNAMVDAEVDIRRTGQKLTVEVLSDSGLRGKILLNLPKYPQYKYGDVLSVKGLLEEPFETEDFSYKRYLERYEVYAVMKNPTVRRIGSEWNNPFYKSVFLVKEEVQERINRLFAEPYASFESGLLLGARKGIPDVILEAFNITGLTHIIAISGYNISLVIILVGAVFSGVARRRRVILSVISIVVFTILVGMSAAVVRAAIMGSIGLAAVYFGRSTRVTLTLLMSALLMNLWNPKILPLDVGFQLSFAATCGIVYVSPKIEKWFTWEFKFWKLKFCVPAAFGIREGLQMTIAAQISTLPIIMFHFGRLSLVSPLANILVAPFIPLSMASGAIAFLADIVSQWLGTAFSGVTWVFLEIIIRITMFCAKIPLASIDIGGFDMVLLVGSYVFLWMWLRE